MNITRKDYLSPPPEVDLTDYRQLQRIALLEYYRLLPENTDPIVIALEQEFTQQQKDIKERFEQECRVAHLCHDPEIDKLEQDNQRQIQEIETQFRQEQNKVTQNNQQKQQFLDNQTQSLLKQAQKKYEEQSLVAEFVAGGVEEKCQSEERQIQDFVKSEKIKLKQLEEQALSSFQRFKLTEREINTTLKSIDQRENLTELYQTYIQEVNQIVNELVTKKLALLLVGWHFWLFFHYW